MMNKSKVTLTNIIAYLQGNIRYYLYYSRFKFMIRKHVLEQIDFRIKFMDKECYENGTCKLCGCVTTALQMADKSCDKPCYPRMMPKCQWRDFHSGLLSVRQDNKTWVYFPPNQNPHLKDNERLVILNTNGIIYKSKIYPTIK